VASRLLTSNREPFTQHLHQSTETKRRKPAHRAGCYRECYKRRKLKHTRPGESRVRKDRGAGGTGMQGRRQPVVYPRAKEGPGVYLRVK